jgi:serine/threonine protein kinase
VTKNPLDRLEQLFRLGLDLKGAERERYLIRECRGDVALYKEAKSLIDSDDPNDEFLDEPIVDLGLRVISASLRRNLTGKTLGNFKILAPLGQGGMGEVYLANDTQLDRKVALKFLSHELVDDSVAKAQLAGEAKAIAQLDHPCICQIYSMQKWKGDAFLVMQYIEGVTLDALLRKRQPTHKQQRHFIHQIVSAVAHTHAKSLIHRDIKPRNIMITSNDQVKILDFGLALSPADTKIVSTTKTRSSSSEVTPGTIRYMSPEQIRGEKLDFRSDVFSLGAVMFEILKGETLFPQREVSDIAAAILAGSYPIDTIPPEHRFAGIIARALAKDPSSRYSSAIELLNDLNMLIALESA